MGQLVDLQRTFKEAIFNDPWDLAKELNTKDDEDFLSRINIYRHTVFASLVDTLKNTFSVIEKILGEDLFRKVAYDFICHDPPQERCLFRYGAKFSDFLLSSDLIKDRPYLKEIAQIQWAENVAHYGENEPSLDSEVFQNVPEEAYGRLVFSLPKTTFFLASELPIQNIWKECEEEKPDLSPKKIGTKKSYCMVIRPAYKTKILWLQKDDFLFLKSLHTGKKLEEAYDEVQKENPDFDLTQALSQALSSGYFTNVKES